MNMWFLKALSFFLLCTAVSSDEDEADGPVEFSWQIRDRPIENAENASIVTSDEIEVRVPYDKEKTLSGVYDINSNTSNIFGLGETPTESNSTVNAENSTATNVTEVRIKMKVECAPRTLLENEIPTVTLANSSTLLKVLAPVSSNKSSSIGECVVVLFYSNQCVFSARMAPHFNALPRVFPDIAFYAVDVMETGNLYVRYGLVYVPNVMLFHNSKPIARCNETLLNLDVFVNFVNKFTGLQHNGTLNVTSVDMNGPVPSTLTRKVDYILILAWVFMLSCLCFGFAKSSVCRRLVELLRNTWYEANAAQHEHEE